MGKVLFAIAVSLACCRIAVAQQKPCRAADYRQAEKEAVTLRSWDALHKSYRFYGRCNDVDAAEGYSESVARILVDRWNTLPRLDEISKKDKGFRHFVLGHLDATCNMEDIEKIRANSVQHCFAGLEQLCKDLRRQAVATLEENAAFHKKH